MAIGVAKDQLRQNAESRAVVVPFALEAEVPAIPAIAERHRDRVRARPNERRDIVRVVLQALVVAGPTWSEQVISHALTIQLDEVETEAGDIESG